jgi:hypothetical protein
MGTPSGPRIGGSESAGHGRPGRRPVHPEQDPKHRCCSSPPVPSSRIRWPAGVRSRSVPVQTIPSQAAQRGRQSARCRAGSPDRGWPDSQPLTVQRGARHCSGISPDSAEDVGPTTELGAGWHGGHQRDGPPPADSNFTPTTNLWLRPPRHWLLPGCVRRQVPGGLDVAEVGQQSLPRMPEVLGHLPLAGRRGCSAQGPSQQGLGLLGVSAETAGTHPVRPAPMALAEPGVALRAARRWIAIGRSSGRVSSLSFRLLPLQPLGRPLPGALPANLVHHEIPSFRLPCLTRCHCFS